MNIFVIQLYEEHERCNFYTVKNDDEDITETDKFFNKYLQTHRQELFEIVKLLDYIGEERGANRFLFRDEASAEALPKNEKLMCRYLDISFDKFPLRLFCLRLSDEIVILFNGGVKDASTAQESSLSMVFQESNIYSKRILSAIQDGNISIAGKTILPEYGREIVIY